MKKITKKKLGQILVSALLSGKVAGSRKKKKLPKPRAVEGFDDDIFLWDGLPLDED